MNLKTKKQIYDNVHGYIGLTDVELKIVDNPLFQRLKNILQLGTANFVYPGATHTRFAHSIGTMFMMSQFLTYINKDGNKLTEDPDQIQKLRLAALLHDIGHYPLSHTTEHVIIDKLNGKDHVSFGTDLIKKFFKENINTYKINEITDIISGKDKTEFGMLISSAFDADKADYLLRDSYHTGVGYGKIAIQRLVRTMSLDKDKIIFEKDEEVVESFLLGRYHMFRSVYHHKTVVSFSLLVEKIFELLVKENYLSNPKDLIKEANEINIVEYTDHTFYTSMYNYIKNGTNNYLKELIKMFLFRKPLSVVYIDPKSSKVNDKSKASLIIKSFVNNDKNKESFAKKADVDSTWLFATEVRPLSLIEDDNRIYIRRKNVLKPLSESNALILNMIGSKTLFDLRLYTKSEYASKVHKEFDKFLKK